MSTQLIERPAQISSSNATVPLASAASLNQALRSAMVCLRVESGLSEADVADTLDISWRYVEGLESGQLKIFKFRDFCSHIRACGGTFTLQLDDWNGACLAKFASEDAQAALQLETSLCRRLRQWHEDTKLSRQELAVAMGISDPTIANIENGFSLLSFENLYSFVNACGGAITVQIFNRASQPIFICRTQKPSEPPKSLLPQPPRIVTQNHVHTVVEFNRAWRNATRDVRLANGLNKTEAAKLADEDPSTFSRGESKYAETGRSLSSAQFYRRILAWEAMAAFIFRNKGSEAATVLLIGHATDFLPQFDQLPDATTLCSDAPQFAAAIMNIFKSRRDELCISQGDLARQTSMDLKNLKRMEKGGLKFGIASGMVFRFISGLDIDLDILVADQKGELVKKFTTAARPDAADMHPAQEAARHAARL